MLRLDIKKYVDDQFENLNQFAKASGLNYQAAQKIYNGETSRITFDNLESICKVLNVTPNNIFIFDNAINNTSQESSKKQVYTMPVLESIRVNTEKLRPEPNSDEALYKLISQIVDDVIDQKLKESNLTELISYVHFALTSEDINNVSYALMI